MTVLATATGLSRVSLERTRIWVERTGIGMPRPVTVTARSRSTVPGAVCSKPAGGV